eukprot:3478015-Amphidinium_carterae.1
MKMRAMAMKNYAMEAESAAGTEEVQQVVLAAVTGSISIGFLSRHTMEHCSHSFFRKPTQRALATLL